MARRKKPKAPIQGADSGAIAVPLEWYFPENLVDSYANQVLVQFGQYESTVSFFKIKQPILLGTPDEQREQTTMLKSVRAECVARIVIALEFMPVVIKTLQETWEKHQEKKAASDAAESVETAEGHQNGEEGGG